MTAPTEITTDTRPRIPFVLPDGEPVVIIFDHGERIPTTTFQRKGGEVVTATRLSETDAAWWENVARTLREERARAMAAALDQAAEAFDADARAATSTASERLYPYEVAWRLRGMAKLAMERATPKSPEGQS